MVSFNTSRDIVIFDKNKYKSVANFVKISSLTAYKQYNVKLIDKILSSYRSEISEIDF